MISMQIFIEYLHWHLLQLFPGILVPLPDLLRLLDDLILPRLKLVQLLALTLGLLLLLSLFSLRYAQRRSKRSKDVLLSPR